MPARLPTLRFLMRLALAAALAAGSFAAPSAAPLQAEEESAEQRRARLEKMSAEQKEAILKKKKRFEAFPKEEQDRLRKLHGEIEAHPQCDRLKQVMENYHEWLKALPSKYQTEVLSTPPDKRVAKIKEVQARVASERLKVIASHLSSQDVSAISVWLEMYIANHEKEFTKRVPPHFKPGLEKLPVRERIARHVRWIRWRLDHPEFLPEPTDEELAMFVAVLSPKAQEILEETVSLEQKWQDAQEFIRQVDISKRFPPVSDEELRKFAASLRPEQREALERKTPEEMKLDLRRMYNWQKAGYGPQGPNPFSWGDGISGPGRGERPGSPREDQRRKEEEANRPSVKSSEAPKQ